MFTRSTLVLTCVALAATVGLNSHSDDIHPRLPGQGLNNCDIDLRANESGEAQVYWKENSATHAVEYEVWDRYSDALLAGNALAENEIQLKAPHMDGATLKTNTVVFVYDTANKTVDLTITNALGDVQEYKKMTPEGDYDPIGPFVEPTMEVARRGAEGKRRIRITCENFGLTYSFTLSDA